MKTEGEKIRKNKKKSPRIHFFSASRQNYNKGFDKGYEEGRKAVNESDPVTFDGTSIIIPTYNQKEYLMECIKSIRDYTSVPFELIIVDDGSSDGTAEYFKKNASELRFKLNPFHTGLNAAVNQGLMMSRGTTIAMLRSEAVVRENWLPNLLACLSSDPQTALSGSDDGLCLVMRRDVFQKIGYMDEGFEARTFDETDYALRARLFGMGMDIVEDALICRQRNDDPVASTAARASNNVSIKPYYKNKWGRDIELRISDFLEDWKNQPASMTDFYPTNVVVNGIGPTLYWVENGIRYPLDSHIGIKYARVSQVDLKQWLVGPAIPTDFLYRKLASLSLPPSSLESLTDGMLVQTPDGVIYQYKKRSLCPIVSDWVLAVWNLDLQTVFPITMKEKERFREGIPIIAPPVLRSDNL